MADLHVDPRVPGQVEDGLDFVRLVGMRVGHVVHDDIETGALLAVGLASSAPIFIEAVRDLGLRQTLADADPAELDLRLVLSNVSAESESVDDVESLIAEEVDAAASSLTVGRMTAMRTGGYILREDDEEFNPPGAKHATFVAQSDLGEVSELVAGRSPAAASGLIEVAVEQEQALAFGIEVGDERLAQPFWLGQQAETRARVVGILDPTFDERRWSTLDPTFLPLAARDSELRFWTTREGILGILADQSPTLRLALCCSGSAPTCTGPRRMRRQRRRMRWR